jgi:hypothetical protein
VVASAESIGPDLSRRSGSVAQDTTTPRVRGPKIEFHPKAVNSDAATFRALAGVIVLKGPVPSMKFLEEQSGSN